MLPFTQAHRGMLQCRRPICGTIPSQLMRLYSQKSGESELAQLRSTIVSGASTQAINEALEKGLEHDFSLYYSVPNAASHVWTPGALKALIDNNPGRAFSSMSLLEKHGKHILENREVQKEEGVILSVVKKLLQGEKSELRELEAHEEFKPSLSSIKQAVALVNLCQTEAVVPYLEMLFPRLVKENELAMLSSFKDIGPWIQAKLDGTKDGKIYFELARILFGIDPKLLSKENLAKALEISGASDDTRYFVDDLLQYIEANNLDLDKKDASSLLLRIQLVHSYLIDKDDVNTGLAKFHHYQTFEKFGLEFVQAKLVQGFCYQAVLKNDTTSLKIAETFVDHDNLTVATLSQLILAHSRFSSEKSLEIYNEYINVVSKDVNEQTGRSPTGSLTEALMVANLYDNDREFALLLYEKAVASGMVKDENEIAVMKRVLKIYGDSFVENSWESAKPIFERYVLQCIRK